MYGYDREFLCEKFKYLASVKNKIVIDNNGIKFSPELLKIFMSCDKFFIADVPFKYFYSIIDKLHDKNVIADNLSRFNAHAFGYERGEIDDYVLTKLIESGTKESYSNLTLFMNDTNNYGMISRMLKINKKDTISSVKDSNFIKYDDIKKFILVNDCVEFIAHRNFDFRIFGGIDNTRRFVQSLKLTVDDVINLLHISDFSHSNFYKLFRNSHFLKEKKLSIALAKYDKYMRGQFIDVDVLHHYPHNTKYYKQIIRYYKKYKKYDEKTKEKFVCMKIYYRKKLSDKDLLFALHNAPKELLYEIHIITYLQKFKKINYIREILPPIYGINYYIERIILSDELFRIYPFLIWEGEIDLKKYEEYYKNIASYKYLANLHTEYLDEDDIESLIMILKNFYDIHKKLPTFDIRFMKNNTFKKFLARSIEKKYLSEYMKKIIFENNDAILWKKYKKWL